MKELLKKIQSVATDLRSIEKDMTVGKGSYSYKAVSDLNVVLKVKESEEKAGIISIPIKQELISSEVVRTDKVNKNNGESIESIVYVDVIKMTLRIYDIETDKYIDIESFGRGLDSSDKGFGKASTYARKYALLNAYKIATGEDPDADKSEKGNIITVNEKVVSVKSYLSKNNKYLMNVLSHFNVGSADDLSEKQILLVYDQLSKKNII